ncbi:hypothetical protein CRN61_11075 [Vibrio vulnificus]|uniref:hypothetical protein n=1 Tax=Vibrio vulnificus TaxID=672 RepID=UPI000C9E532E|nr:hypothetical protein [Vibrio vulnificus]MCU8344058.1 hypothetical protein [Vibrio vulnificus]PNG63558.1 hypothetical protein SC81_16100 [Vibrio vulnificus]POC13604.1 hypothetical protein CRN54_02085 [Vibrio vulnificus]POC79302.1 hypothetical protein CRN61_11075 [Vibrio vulnificus]
MKKIIIVDDDSDARESLAIIAEDAGFEPEIITGRYGNNKEKLIDDILSLGAEGVISDHRLAPGHLASFFGADLLASLYDRNIPTVLITQFYDEDADSTIRLYRDKLPSVIGRGSQTPELFRKLLIFSENELMTARDVTRKPHRALIRLDDFNTHIAEGTLEGIITNWNSKVGVRFPARLIPDDVKEKLKTHEMAHISAFVNIGAKDPKDIFITDIHAMPAFEEIDIDDLC